MKAIDIIKPTALFLTKIMAVVVFVCTLAQCNNTNQTTEVQKEGIAEEEPFARENKVLQWYLNERGFVLDGTTRYLVLVSDRTCVGCGSWVLKEMLDKNLDSTMLIITTKLCNKYPLLTENPRIFLDEHDVINTLNWDYPDITDVTLVDGKIVDINEHVIISDENN